MKAKGHPIAPPSGVVGVARVVLYEKIGPGPHPCRWWCGESVDWMPGSPVGTPGMLVCDHLDHDATNDHPENLAPSCNPCNAHRRINGDSRRILPGELTVEINGVRNRAVRRVCEGCGEPFLMAKKLIRPGKGRFCSRSCARRAPRST